ncbi:MAG TPA: M23 family metallopeptidase [Allosphingosinicella sp.]|jgi:murein DD-endopeptidase MepM/ murein hydrolase activator NlpD|nr:M23 family metallopeptidase [Allosphingosinicella sp.]
MRRLGVAAIVIITAVVTAALTSAFWLIAFNAGRRAGPSAPGPQNVITETTEPDNRPELVLGPGGLAVPVAGVRVQDLVDTYTQSRAGGARVHDAIDIMAPAGAPVVAAAEGTVEKLYFSRGGGGITVYVRSPDRRWIYYYAHLQEYAPGLTEGQRVERGGRLGSVGSTGNANPAGPHLHFAVHQMAPDEPWYEGTPVNPYPLLAGRGPAR